MSDKGWELGGEPMKFTPEQIRQAEAEDAPEGPFDRDDAPIDKYPRYGPLTDEELQDELQVAGIFDKHRTQTLTRLLDEVVATRARITALEQELAQAKEALENT